MIDSKKLAEMRVEYISQPLTQEDVHEDPMMQFAQWFKEALDAGTHEPNAMTLATSNNGVPSARIVLLKGATSRGFTFYTNYQSRKADEMKINPNVALVFFWHELARQVRIEGLVQKVSKQESEDYFHIRPKASQISATISPQSRVIGSKTDLEEMHHKLSEEFSDKEVPLPDYWGGYLVVPSRMEFWQGRENRFHDRIQYRLVDGQWIIERLAP